MFTPTHLIKISSTYPCCRCTKLLLTPYTLYGVVNMYGKFHGCTEYVQASTLILTTVEQTLHYVHTLNVCHLALHYVSVMDGVFH